MNISHKSGPIAKSETPRRPLQARDLSPSTSSLPAPVADEIGRERLIELLRAIPLPFDNYPDEGRQARLLLAKDRVKLVMPNDGLESLLADQMTVTHSMFMEYFARANESGGNPVQSSAYLNQAKSLASLFLKQMTAFDKHRHGGRQKVVVEHVNVEPGGSALVGHVDARRQLDGPPAEAIPVASCCRKKQQAQQGDLQ